MHPVTRPVSRGFRTPGAAGFVLIEVLISVLIFAVGVLALVGLQVSMTRAQTESKVRADASYLANELVGLMWADAANLNNYADSGCASLSQCAAWKSKVQHALPSGNAAVAVVTAAGIEQGKVTVNITWTSPTGDSHRYQTETVVKTAAQVW